jgi:hypothetical protein
MRGMQVTLQLLFHGVRIVPVMHRWILHARAGMCDFMCIRELLEQGEPIVQRVPSSVPEMY